MIGRPVLALVVALSAPVPAGAILAAVTEPGSVPYILGFVLIGVSAVLLVAAAFYAIGRSEDRAREAEGRRRHGA